MQLDAQKRVEHMQRQANEAMRNATHRPEPPTPEPQPTISPLSSIRTLLQDEERLMLLILLFLLSREKTDPALLLALVYLMR